MNRRDLLRRLGLAAASLPWSGGAPARSVPAPGIQLYMMQGPLVRDFSGTLEALGRIGYREVEVVSLLGHEPTAFRAALDMAALSAPSLHIVSKEAEALFLGMAAGTISPNDAWANIDAAMDLANIEAMMEHMFMLSSAFGNQYLVLAATDSTLFESRAGINRVVSAYTKAGDLCFQRGLKFAFHPHLAEFRRLDGGTAVDWILRATDPDKVFVELDFFWAAMANADIPKLLDRYRGRFHLGHVKDLSKGFTVPVGGFKDLDAISGSPFEDVGYGKMDYRKLIRLGRKAGMRHLFVERDQAPDPLKNAERSYSRLKALLS